LAGRTAAHGRLALRGAPGDRRPAVAGSASGRGCSLCFHGFPFTRGPNRRPWGGWPSAGRRVTGGPQSRARPLAVDVPSRAGFLAQGRAPSLPRLVSDLAIALGSRFARTSG